MNERRIDGERLARVEATLDGLRENFASQGATILDMSININTIRLSLAEQKGIRSAMAYVTHTFVGIAGVIAAYLGLKNGG